jgi:hypothetical protein
MSRDIALTYNEEVADLVIEENDILIYSDTDVVAMNARTRLLTILAEWYYDYTIGIDWFDQMFSTATSYDQKVAILKAEILKDPEITSITSFTFAIDPVTREGEIEFTADTIFSPITVQVAV